MKRSKKPFPWWRLIWGFLIVRWAMRIAAHPERAPQIFHSIGISLAIGLITMIIALQVMKKYFENKLSHLKDAEFVPISIAGFAAGDATSASPIPSPIPSPSGRSAQLPFDLPLLDQWSQQLYAMGFSWLLDYSLDEKSRQTAPGKAVARLMVHPAEGVYACIRQTIMNGQALPIRPALYSFTDNGEIITVGAKALDSNLLTARPQDVSDFLPDCTAQQLMDKHFERRQQVQRFLGKSFGHETSAEFYLQFEKQGAPRLGEAYRKTNVFRLLGALLKMGSTRSLPGELGPHIQS